jgi:hypothetical protein
MRDLGPALRSTSMMFFRCEENVLRLCSMLCSSPMSAKTSA